MVNTDWEMLQMNHTKEMGLESVFDQTQYAHDLERRRHSGDGRERGGGGGGCSNVLCGLLDMLQAGVVLEGVRQRNCSIVTDLVAVEPARSG